MEPDVKVETWWNHVTGGGKEMGKRWEKDGKKMESNEKGGNIVEARNMAWKRNGK